MMTEKDFLDVFPQLKVAPELESLLGETHLKNLFLSSCLIHHLRIPVK